MTTDIAIVGMGCIFPKANGLKEYWRVLFNGEDTITDIPEDSHWAIADYFNPDPAKPDHTYCRRGGFLPAVSFDPLAYGIPPNNLTATDTSQLLGLLVAQMALEDAGYPIDHAYLSEKTVNVILGVTGTQELVIPLGARLGHPFWKKALDDSGISGEKKDEVIRRIESSYVPWQENSFPGLLGNVVAGRIANKLNLTGTNSVSDAACASSLSALHTSVMELAAGKCDMSITGGVDTLNDIFMHMCFSKTGVLSHDSDARPFSKDADGTVLGEGIGMLVLKRLADAIQDDNRIYAVIKAVGTSSDGKTSGIYTPSSEGQARALRSAYDQAGFDPATLELVEAHGTGTRVGDKVEFSSLTSTFHHPDKTNYCAIGSVKSMIGHTKAAAGIAGVIKAALALYHKVIPPTLKAQEPDPELEINASPFYLNDRSKPWLPGSSAPRRSGVSAFGFGGSNFHTVLEEYRSDKDHVSWDGTVQIAAFSAPDPDTLIRQINAFKSELHELEGLDSRERSNWISWKTGLLRDAFSNSDDQRLLFIIRPENDLTEICQEALKTIAQDPLRNDGAVYYHHGPCQGKLGFLFPGQGSQYPHMGKALLSMFPEAQSVLHACETEHAALN
ncbi:MAG: polyketide-type polyunsaturated fatty acid synthase PfaA, partial [Desulfobacteraceae bacterium]